MKTFRIITEKIFRKSENNHNSHEKRCFGFLQIFRNNNSMQEEKMSASTQSNVKETNYTMFEMYPDVLNVTQAAKAMNMGRNKIYSYLKSGKIKSIRDGNTESAK